MFMRTLLATVIAGSAVSVASAQEPQRVIAFVNVNVVPLDRERVEAQQTVLVRGDRIVAIGSANEIALPQGVLTIDGAGQYLLPGLTDAHVHLEMGMPWAQARPDFGDAPLYLSYGVTTVMNMGGTPTGTPTVLEWRKRIEAGSLVGPTIYTAGPFVNEPRVRTPEEVEREIVEQRQRGYDFIKFHEVLGMTTGLSLPTYRRMLETSRRVGMPLIGHAPVNLGLDEALQSRQSFAHVGMLSNVYFLPLISHTTILLVTIGAFLVLILVAFSIVLAAMMRRVSHKKRDSARELSIFQMLTVVLAGVTVTAILCLVLVLPGGPLFNSALVRVTFSVLAVVVAILGARTFFAAALVSRVRATTITEKVRAFVVGISAVALSVALLAFGMPLAWRSSDNGISEVAQKVRDSGIFIDSTLVVYATLNQSTQKSLLEDRAIDFLIRPTRDMWRAQPKPLISTSYLGFMEKVVGALHRHSVPIMAGTDAMGLPLLAPGSSLHRELALLAASGLPPYEVIRAATVVPAAFLGKSNQFGTIAPGQRADLLLVRGNPFENLNVLEKPTGVMVRGAWLPRQKLDEMLKPLATGE
jgi:hypothetical protein